jgi:hypothetical protein
MTMSTAIRGGKTASRPTKEAFYVRYKTPDGGLVFDNATMYIGKEMPFTNPQATCAMRVEGDTVSFSLLHLSKRTVAGIVSKPIAMPKGPLMRLQRQAHGLELAPGEIVVEMDDKSYRLRYSVDDGGRAEVDVAPGGVVAEGEEADPVFSLPRTAVQMSLYMRSSTTGRTLALSFIGYLGQPDTPETLSRAAAKVLNSISGLSPFRVLSGIESVKMPSAPSKWAAHAAMRKPEEQVVVEIEVTLVTAEHEPVASGTAVVEIDLDNVNPSTDRLLFYITPSDALKASFGDYRGIINEALGDVLRKELGRELTPITFEVVLGEVESGTIERLREVMGKIKGIDVSPSEFKIRRIEKSAAPEVSPGAVPEL